MACLGCHGFESEDALPEERSQTIISSHLPHVFFFRTEVKTKYSLRLNGGSFQLSKAKTELCSFSNTFIYLDSESRSDMIFRD